MFLAFKKLRVPGAKAFIGRWQAAANSGCCQLRAQRRTSAFWEDVTNSNTTWQGFSEDGLTSCQLIQFLLLTKAHFPASGPFSPLHTSYVGNNRLLIFQRGIKVIACCENPCWLCKSGVCPHFSSLGFLFMFIIFSVGTRLPRFSKDICPGFSSGVPGLYLWIPPNKVQWESTDGQGDNFV